MDGSLPWGLAPPPNTSKFFKTKAQLARAHDVVGIIAHAVLPVASWDLIDFSSRTAELPKPISGEPLVSRILMCFLLSTLFTQLIC